MKHTLEDKGIMVSKYIWQNWVTYKWWHLIFIARWENKVPSMHSRPSNALLHQSIYKDRCRWGKGRRARNSRTSVPVTLSMGRDSSFTHMQKYDIAIVVRGRSLRHVSCSQRRRDSHKSVHVEPQYFSKSLVQLMASVCRRQQPYGKQKHLVSYRLSVLDMNRILSQCGK